MSDASIPTYDIPTAVTFLLIGLGVGITLATLISFRPNAALEGEPRAYVKSAHLSPAL